MKRNFIAPLAACAAFVAGGTAQSQVVPTDTKSNQNVKKIEGTVNSDGTFRAMTNPAQTRVRIDDPILGRTDLRIKPGTITTTPPLTNVEIEPRILNDNVSKVDATADGITARGIINPAQTHVHGRAVDGSKVDVRIKPPK
jgi:hypothetical protein